MDQDWVLDNLQLLYRDTVISASEASYFQNSRPLVWSHFICWQLQLKRGLILFFFKSKWTTSTDGITEVFTGREPWGHLVSCGFVQPNLKNLQGWRYCNNLHIFSYAMLLSQWLSFPQCLIQALQLLCTVPSFVITGKGLALLSLPLHK